MNKEVPVFLKPLAEADEKLYAIVDETLGLVHCEGALEPKYKHLMSMVADAMCHHTSGAVACMREAIEAGATKEPGHRGAAHRVLRGGPADAHRKPGRLQGDPGAVRISHGRQDIPP